MRPHLVLLFVAVCLLVRCKGETQNSCSPGDSLCAPWEFALLGTFQTTTTYLAGGQSAGSCAIFRSTNDADSWSLVHTNANDCTLVTGMVAGNGGYVAVGGNGGTSACGLFYSGDGSSWTDLACPAGAGYLQDVIFANGVFVGVGATGGGNAAIVTSPDGLNWTFQSTGLAQILNSVTFANNTYYYGTNGDGVYTTPDPSVLATVVGVTAGGTINSVRSDDQGRVFAASNAGNSFYSIDGTNFTALTIMANGATGERPFRVLSMGTGFIALGGIASAGGDCLLDYSTDAINWNGGYLLDPFCTVDSPLFYLPLHLVRAGSFYFASGYEFNTGSVAATYLARSLDPFDTDGWALEPFGTDLLGSVITD